MLNELLELIKNPRNRIARNILWTVPTLVVAVATLLIAWKSGVLTAQGLLTIGVSLTFAMIPELAFNRKTRKSGKVRRKSSNPPFAACLLLDAIPPHKRNELLGHYYEEGEFDIWRKKYGHRAANFLYWFRISILCIHLLAGILTSSLIKRLIGK